MLSNLSEEYCQAAFQYGKNAGLAFQVLKTGFTSTFFKYISYRLLMMYWIFKLQSPSLENQFLLT